MLVCAIMKIDNIDFIGYSLLNVGNRHLQGNLQTEERMKEIKRVKGALKFYLDMRCNYNWLMYPITTPPCDEPEEKLLNSDDEVVIYFYLVKVEKRMKLEGDA